MFERVISIVNDFRHKANDQILGIGVALPGPFLESCERIILMTESPQCQSFDCIHELRLSYPEVPISSGHDAKLAALAVWRDNAIAIGASAMLYVMLGQGVGSALVINGKVFKGSRGFAGELGHTSIDRNGPLCKCGNRGCLELYTSTLALLRRVHEGVREGRTTSLTEDCSFDDVVAAWHANDPLAKAEVERVAECLGQGLVNCINFINPDLIVLGEEAVAFGDSFLEIVDRKLKAMVLPSIFERTATKLFGLEGDIAMIGSCIDVLQRVLLSRRAPADQLLERAESMAP